MLEWGDGQEVVRLANTYKLLVIDIDGTLIGRDGVISAEDRQALAKAGAAGIVVTLSTGRVMRACTEILDQLSLDGYHIFFDGALVSNPVSGEEIYARPIDGMMVKQALEFSQLNGINLEFYSVERYFVQRETWGSNVRRNFYHTPPTVVDLSQLWNTERIIKGVLTLLTLEEKSRAELLYHQFQGALSFSLTKSPAYPDVDFMNVLAPDVSKGKALEALCSFLGIPLSRVAAVGDGVNDIPLLNAAGLGIAMGNAPYQLKAVADYVTLDIEHHGLAEIVKKFLI